MSDKLGKESDAAQTTPSPVSVRASKRKLSHRLTRNTLLLAMSVGLLLNLVQVSLEYLDAQREIRRDVLALERIAQSPASHIAYNLDAHLARELLNGLLKHSGVVAGRIVDPSGEVLAAAARPESSTANRWLTDILFGPSYVSRTELHVAAALDIDLGHLELTIDTGFYGDGFLRRSFNTLLLGALKSLVLSMILLVVFHFIITEPLTRLVRTLREVKPDTPEKARLPMPRGHEDDELGVMVTIINQHLAALDESLDRTRAAEAEIKGYSASLEQQVRDRTRQILEKSEALEKGNRALVKAKEEAMVRARNRADFLANMSHEIRTPLNGLLGMLSLTLEQPLQSDQRDRLQIALTAGTNLLRLLNDILDISKIEAGKLTLEHIEFDLREIVEECASLIVQPASVKGINLISQTHSSLAGTYCGDPTRIRQILNNLLSNAIKFTEQGEVRITAKALTDSKLVRLDVEDTGIGMTQEGLNRIFTAFAQADIDTTRRYGGTGLGLTLCRQLIERMHGQISVDSAPGKGSRFRVTLPLPVAVSQPETPELPEPLKALGILIVASEQNPHLPSLTDCLQAWGIPFRLADHGDLNNQVPAPEPIVIVDASIPVEAELNVEQVKTIELVETSAKALRQGATHLTLPFSRRRLLNALYSAENGSHQAAAEPAKQENGKAGSGRQLLLVEDNRVNQMVARAILENLGHEVDIADNGEQALERVRNRPYDLILMDCQMPVMNGFEATRRIRTLPGGSSIPIIAMTANVMDGDREACFEAGMDEYITKPYQRDELKEAIARLTAQ